MTIFFQIFAGAAEKNGISDDETPKGILRSVTSGIPTACGEERQWKSKRGTPRDVQQGLPARRCVRLNALTRRRYDRQPV
jgi:hypothetical protein